MVIAICPVELEQCSHGFLQLYHGAVVVSSTLFVVAADKTELVEDMHVPIVDYGVESSIQTLRVSESFGIHR